MLFSLLHLSSAVASELRLQIEALRVSGAPAAVVNA